MKNVMELYHGTTKDSANKILKKVDVKLGGGELGRGFYLGESSRLACRWALQKSKQLNKPAALVCCTVPLSVTSDLETLFLNKEQAKEKRKIIKKEKRIRSFKFKMDLIISPIVGKVGLSSYKQYKFESDTSEGYVNNLIRECNEL